MDVICFMKLHLSKMCLKPDTEMGVLSGRSSQPDFVQDVLKKKRSVCVGKGDRNNTQHNAEYQLGF